MSWVDTLSDATDAIFETAWDERDGQVIPDTDDVKLKGGAVKLDATFLYADLAGSSVLASKCPWGTTAKVIRAYLDCSTRLIRAWQGEIKSFDGDRVMGVFLDGTKNSNATRCAQEIDYTVEKIIGPKAKAAFKSIRDNDIKIRHAVGIDTGVSRAVRAGIRSNSDLIWVGRAPSLAAKLSDIRKYPYSVHISSSVYKALIDDAKYYDGDDMWVSDDFVHAGQSLTIYKTKQMRKP